MCCRCSRFLCIFIFRISSWYLAKRQSRCRKSKAFQSTPRIPSRVCSSQTISSKAPSLNSLLGASFPGTAGERSKELEMHMALPMCISTSLNKRGTYPSGKELPSRGRAQARCRGTPDVRGSQSQSRTEEDVCRIKRPLTGSKQPLSSCLFIFLVLFLVSFRLLRCAISERVQVQGRSRPS